MNSRIVLCLLLLSSSNAGWCDDGGGAHDNQKTHMYIDVHGPNHPLAKQTHIYDGYGKKHRPANASVTPKGGGSWSLPRSSVINLRDGELFKIGGVPPKVADWRPSTLGTSRYLPFHGERNEAELLFSLALHKQTNNDLPGAIADYLAAINIDDQEPAVHWYLGTAYEAAGKATEAKQEFEKEQEMTKVRKYSEGYGSGTGRGYGGGDFGSNKLKFVPGEGLTKPRSDGK